MTVGQRGEGSADGALSRPAETLALLGLLGLSVYFFLASSLLRDLWNPDEPRYAEVAREMVRSGHWLVPRLSGVVYSDKPPAFFWLVALFSWPFGDVSGATARLPVLFAALGTTLLTLAFGARLYGKRAAMFSGFALVTSALWLWLSQSPHIDVVVTFLITLAIYSAYRGLDAERGKNRWYALFFVACGIGLLTKGPVAVILPFGIGGIFALRKSGLKRLNFLPLLWGIPITLAIPALWFVPATMQAGPSYAKTLLFHHTLDAYRSSWNHAGPVYYYFLDLPANLFPWTLFLPGAVALFLARRRETVRSDTWLPVIWFLFTFIFFSGSSAKRGLYLAPLYPAAALLVGDCLGTISSPLPVLRRAWFRVPLLVTYSIIAAASLALVAAIFFGDLVFLNLRPEVATRLFQYSEGPVEDLFAVAAIVVLVLCLLHIALLSGGNRLRHVSRLAVVITVMWVLLFPFWCHFGNAMKSARPLVMEIRKNLAPDRVLAYWRRPEPAINFYLGVTDIPVISEETEALAMLGRDPDLLIIIKESHYSEWWDQIDAAATVVAHDTIGHNRYFLLKGGRPKLHETLPAA